MLNHEGLTPLCPGTYNFTNACSHYLRNFGCSDGVLCKPARPAAAAAASTSGSGSGSGSGRTSLHLGAVHSPKRKPGGCFVYRPQPAEQDCGGSEPRQFSG